MKCLVTGGAGFIGSELADSLAAKGHCITVLDNMSNGRMEFLERHIRKNYFEFVKGDIMDKQILEETVKGTDMVFHFAANSDTIKGIEKTDTDLEMNVRGTYNVLEAMRVSGVRKIVFPSSSTVYGLVHKPVSEEYAPLLPRSLYGASKLASESFISAFCHSFGMQAWVYRLANILGPRITHGVVFDFMKKLEKNPKELRILGDGRQKKPYVHVSDCVAGMLTGIEKSREKINVFNISCDSQTTVRKIAEIVSGEMGLDPEFKFTGGETGWPGDLPSFFLETGKLRNLGWSTRYASDEAVRVSVKEHLETKRQF